MADASYAQISFLGGEWSKDAQGRIDRPDYRTAMNICVNAFPIEQGSWTRRPGTRHAGLTRAGQAGRVLPFDFQQSIPYTLEFTSSYLRFRQGASFVTTNDDQLVVSISGTNPAEVQIGGIHHWTTGNAVIFTNLGTAMPLLQNRVFNIIVTATNKFQIVDSVTGAGINGAVLGLLPANVIVKRLLEVLTPYSGTTWRDVRVVQAEKTAILLHPTFPPQRLVASPAPVSLDALPPPAGVTVYTFALDQPNFIDGPYLDPFTNGAQITPNAVNGIITISLTFSPFDAARAYSVGDFVLSAGVNYQSIQDQNVGHVPAASPTFWTAVSAGVAVGPNGFTTTDIGRLIRMFDASSHWTWGKIVSTANLIDPGLAGSSNIGNFGNLGAAFDGVVNQASAICAVLGPSTDPLVGFLGKDYTGAGGRAIAYGVLWPSNDLGHVYATKTYTTTTSFYQLQLVSSVPTWVLQSGTSSTVTLPTPVSSITINLRAKMTSPASSADGTLLATTNVVGGIPVTLVSNDQTTVWNFVWFEVVASSPDLSIPADITSDRFGQRAGGPLTDPGILVPGSNPNRTTTGLFIGDTGFITTTTLNSYNITDYAAEAQFATPPGTGAGNSVNVQILGPALANTNTLSLWQLGTYSNTTGFPTCGTYHEGRLWLAGAVPNRIDGSRSNLVFDFSPTTVTGQVVDSNAISATFNAKDVNSIFWLEPDQLGIIAGTPAGDWLVQASNNNNPLTPTSIQAHRYSRLACANIEPRRADNGPLIVVQRFQRKIFEHFPDVYSGRITAQNITQNLRHMTKSGVVELAYQREPTPIIWARCNNGEVFGITYRRDTNAATQLPTFVAGHRHRISQGRVIESIAVGPSADGSLDTLTMVTNDASAIGQRHVELLAPLMEEGDPTTTAWFLDNAISPSSTLVSGTQFIINGVHHLNGKTAHVFAGGLDCETWPVVDGTITVTFGDGVSEGTGAGLFTADFVASFGGAMPVVVGLDIVSQGQIVRPATPAESGARNGPAIGKKRRTHLAAFLFESCGPISIGTTFGDLRPALFKTDGGRKFTEGQMFSGVYRATIEDDYTYDSMVCWQIEGPYPSTVVAIEGFLQTTDV